MKSFAEIRQKESQTEIIFDIDQRSDDYRASLMILIKNDQTRLSKMRLFYGVWGHPPEGKTRALQDESTLEIPTNEASLPIIKEVLGKIFESDSVVTGVRAALDIKILEHHFVILKKAGANDGYCELTSLPTVEGQEGWQIPSSIIELVGPELLPLRKYFAHPFVRFMEAFVNYWYLLLTIQKPDVDDFCNRREVAQIIWGSACSPSGEDDMLGVLSTTSNFNQTEAKERIRRLLEAWRNQQPHSVNRSYKNCIDIFEFTYEALDSLNSSLGSLTKFVKEIGLDAIPEKSLAEESRVRKEWLEAVSNYVTWLMNHLGEIIVDEKQIIRIKSKLNRSIGEFQRQSKSEDHADLNRVSLERETILVTSINGMML